MSTGSAPDPSPVIAAFVVHYLEDRERGIGTPLAEYQARYPGYEAEIAREFERLERDSDDASETGAGGYRGVVGLPAGELPTTQPAASRYGDEGEIGRGGMGSVRRVWDRELRRQVAMKVLRDDDVLEANTDRPASRPQATSRFLEEARVTAQLEHPGIVPVHELGVDADGNVYFTMSLVRGRTLKEVIESVRAGDREWTLARALGVLLRVCEAVAFAHSKGVVHRDLKPANVMVGHFGETYVMDWGLARVRGVEVTAHADAAPSGEPAASIASGRRELAAADPASPLVTMAGDVIGTPAYMAPEQARGEVEQVGTPADVYALGAMLYHLLTGEMPYVPGDERAPSAVVLRRVVAGPPRPLHEIERSVPAELAAICERAMARAPERRYGGVRELADDLRAFLEMRVVHAYESGALAELKKWVRRNKSLALASAAAVLALVVGLFCSLVEKRRADDQARIAEARFGDAFDAVERMLTRISADTLANVPGAQRVRRDLMRDALEFHQRFLTDHGDDPKVREKVFQSQSKVGLLHWTLAEYDQSEAAQRRALELGEVLIAAHPDRDDLKEQLASVKNQLGILFEERGRDAEAEAFYRPAHDELSVLVARHPGEARYLATLSLVQHNMAVLLMGAGRLTEALEHAERSLDSKRELIRLRGNDASFRRSQLAESNLIGEILRRLRRLPEAEQCFAEAAAAYQALLEDDPQDQSFRSGLGLVLINLGLVQSQTRADAVAAETYRRAIETFRRLTADFPSVPEHHSDLGAGLTNLATLHSRHQRQAEALTAAGQAIAAQRAAFGAAPDNRKYRSRLRNAYGAVIGSLMGLGRYREAAERVAEYAELDPGARRLGDAASWTARCARSAEQDATLGEAERRALRTSYFDRVVGYLDAAAAAGFRGGDELWSEVFDPLREDPRFSEIVARLAVDPDQSRREDREKTLPVRARWVRDRTREELEAITAEGWRITDLEVQSSSPLRFTAALVENAGDYHKRWWWLADADLPAVQQAVEQHAARIVDVELLRGGNERRVAVILVQATGVDAKGWYWWFGTRETVTAKAAETECRFVCQSSYESGSDQEIAAVMIKNVGRDRRSWKALFDVDPDAVDAEVASGWRVYDLHRPSGGDRVHCILVKGPAVDTSHFFGHTAEEVDRLLEERRARLVDIGSFERDGRRLYDGVLVGGRRR